MKIGSISIWRKEDIDGFFGLFTNNLTNLLVMSGLLTLSVGFPAEIVYGRIVPAAGLAVFVASLCYSFLAYRLARKTGRDDVTAFPTGISVPHMFLIVYLVIGPVYWKTNDPYLAWAVGIVWCFIEGLVELLGAFVGEKLRNIIPNPALLGSLAGVSIAFIAMTPAMQTWAVPYIGLVSFVIILLGWFGKVKMPFRIPVGLLAIVVGTAIGWLAGVMDMNTAKESLVNMQFSYPIPSIDRLLSGFGEALPFLASAVPLGIYNFFESLENIESAHVAGDPYDTKSVLLVDGSVTMMACVFGSPFPVAAYIGHAGWKETGARIGYSWATGLSMLLLTWFGVISLLLNVIPIYAIVPILIYIALMIGSQAFQATEHKYTPAVVVAIIPWILDWGSGVIDTALSTAGTSASEIGFDVLASAGLEYGGMIAVGSGSIVVSMIWASIVVYIIDSDFHYAGYASLIAAGLAYFGFIHAGDVGFGVGGQMAVSYLMVAAIFFLMRFRTSKQKIKGV